MPEPIPVIAPATPATRRPRGRTSFARRVAILNLLAASRPELGDLPIEVRIDSQGSVWLEVYDRGPVAASIAADVAKALRAPLNTYDSKNTEGRPFTSYEVDTTFNKIPIHFYGYRYMDGEQPAESGEPK